MYIHVTNFSKRTYSDMYNWNKFSLPDRHTGKKDERLSGKENLFQLLIFETDIEKNQSRDPCGTLNRKLCFPLIFYFS